jgi:anti-sigma B factor antagonist
LPPNKKRKQEDRAPALGQVNRAPDLWHLMLTFVNVRSPGFRYSPFLMPAYKLDLVKLPISNEIMSVYRPKGKFSLETVSDAIPKLRADTAAHMILDFSEVSFLDSAGVGALVSLFVSRRGHGRTFGMAALSKQSNAVVTVAGLQNYLPVYPTLDEALAKKP